MSKFLISILLIATISSCNQQQTIIPNQTPTMDSVKIQSNIIQDTLSIVSDKEFVSQINAYKTLELPYKIKTHIWVPNYKSSHIEDENNYNIIWSRAHKPLNKLDSMDVFFKFKDILGLEEFLYERIDEVDTNWSLLLLERFQPLNDSIEVLLLSSNNSESNLIYWIIATYDKINNVKVDNVIVGVFESFGDTYWESYFSIDSNYSIKSIIASHYESNPEYTEYDYKVNSNGSIKRFETQKYSYANNFDEEGDNLLSYEKSIDSYYVRFFEGEPVGYSEDEAKSREFPDFFLGYKENGTIDSTITLTKPIIINDNQNRKWMHIYSYSSIDLGISNAHYKRYYYDPKTQMVNNIQEVKYKCINDSTISIAFRSGISDSVINQKQFIKFNYHDPYFGDEWEKWTWYNIYFNVNSLEELESKY